MLTIDTKFERELTKLLNEEIDRLKDQLSSGAGVGNFEQYKEKVGQINSLRKTVQTYIPDISKLINERN